MMYPFSWFVIYTKEGDTLMFEEVKTWQQLDRMSKLWYIVRHPLDYWKEWLQNTKVYIIYMFRY